MRANRFRSTDPAAAAIAGTCWRNTSMTSSHRGAAAAWGWGYAGPGCAGVAARDGRAALASTSTDLRSRYCATRPWKINPLWVDGDFDHLQDFRDRALLAAESAAT